MPGLSSTTARSRQGQHETCRNTIPVQSSHVTDAKRTSDMFSAFVQATAGRQVLSHLYPVDVGSASPTSFGHPLHDATEEQTNDFHSVPGSPDVHSEGHFQKHLVLPGGQLHLHHRPSRAAETPQAAKPSPARTAPSSPASLWS